MDVNIFRAPLEMNNIKLRTPLISVITAVYNGSLFVEETIRSVLNQTVDDFEYIIIDDASTDDSVDRILAFRDPRIKLIRNLKNKKLVDTRNIGLRASAGKFVALIDHDDIALPNRFEEQLKYFEVEPNLVLVGCLAEDVDERGNKLEPRIVRYDSPEDLHARLLFRNPFVNSTLMINRSSGVELFYTQEFPLSEDYDFIERAACVGRVAIVPKVLLQYRIHSNNFSNKESHAVINFSKAVKRRQLLALGVNVRDDQLSFHSLFENKPERLESDFLQFAPWWISYLLDANNKTGIYDSNSFRRIVYNELITVAHSAAKQGNFHFFLIPNLILLKVLVSSPFDALKMVAKLFYGAIK